MKRSRLSAGCRAVVVLVLLAASWALWAGCTASKLPSRTVAATLIEAELKRSAWGGYTLRLVYVGPDGHYLQRNVPSYWRLRDLAKNGLAKFNSTETDAQLTDAAVPYVVSGTANSTDVSLLCSSLKSVEVTGISGDESASVATTYYVVTYDVTPIGEALGLPRRVSAEASLELYDDGWRAELLYDADFQIFYDLRSGF